MVAKCCTVIGHVVEKATVLRWDSDYGWAVHSFRACVMVHIMMVVCVDILLPSLCQCQAPCQLNLTGACILSPTSQEKDEASPPSSWWPALLHGFVQDEPALLSIFIIIRVW